MQITKYGIDRNDVVETREVNHSPWVRFTGSDLFQKLCTKCGGSGDHWSEIADHECFQCHGAGTEPRVASKTNKQLDSMIKAYAAKAIRDAKNAEMEAETQRIHLRERDHAYALKVNENWTPAALTEFAGEEKDKVQLTGEIVFSKYIMGDYGMSRMLIIKISDTMKIKIFGTSAWMLESWPDRNVDVYVVGSVITFKGTIKKNEVFNRENVSILTRVKLVEA